MTIGDTATLDRDGLDRLVVGLRDNGYRVIGPQVRDNAIVLDELDSPAALATGWGVETAPGRYRIHRRTDAAVFAHSAGPGSWKQFLHPPRRRIERLDADLNPVPVRDDPVPTAFLGVRGCDMAAIATLGRVLGGGAHPDPDFASRRAGLFIVAVNCTEPGGVCFCASMGTGPGVSAGYDLALTERLDAAGHRFLVEVGSAAGERILAGLHADPATAAEVTDTRAEVAAGAGKMGRAMPELDLRTLIRDSRDSPHWQDIASRCLTCANCTMVCPTCFCTSTEDQTDLTGEHAERWEHWASCFELDFSYLHGGSVRQSGEGRYRQWLSHKLSTWHDQFGSSGCVGCGRCIAWCPAGIDITAEAARFAELRQKAETQEGDPDGDR
ncbi:4Fe-4S dicluster domain-containing protein [Nocardia seriolae]|uniref:Ferredoxin n=1 Tax=Nocardia seriolae TaxID=37332 RepID=A0ABC8AW47_9NOCA|nr:4Fe-4S dicluster domain-containing protein [Nocardia seriolae]APA98425.1 Sulfhydrogenase [Nocardia seriolae]OJF80312.1 4Fe-4S ferredoxin [Nocardia seriolae]PSK29157.1 4Fe-4S ferredoxin [Nocardia seriolae]QOW35739.1 4Fe-4S dicluster domain-containing protein [Nocardia seriolae]QUN16770.1 4Fe-4S dicluster domain-containing protein [Nocardia seriolae]